MKKYIFLVSIFYSCALLSQTNLPNDLKSKYHALTYEELNNKNLSKNFVATNPPQGHVRNIAEFEPNQGVIIAFPDNFEIPTLLIKELAQYVKVYVICSNISNKNRATTIMTNASVNMANVEFIMANIDSQWTRDYSPLFIEHGETKKIGIVDFPYNRPRPNDDNVPIVIGQQFNIPVFGMNIVQTGGNYMTDGYGISASCDLVKTENRNWTQTQIDSLVNIYIGITKYHLVPDPLNDYIEHIDCWGKFLDVDKIIISKVPQSDYRYANFEAMANYWANQISSYGNKYKVYRVNWTTDGNAYTNSLIMNNKVFVPFNTGSAGASNAAAAQAYQNAMPGYEIIGINYSDWYSTDALHCRTHEFPDTNMLRIKHLPYLDTLDNRTQFEFNADVYSLNNANNINYVQLYYKINDQEYNIINMNNLQNGKYQAVLSGLNENDKISYYIKAEDNRPKVEFHPYIANANPHVFYIKSSTSNNNINYSNSSISAYPNPASEILFFITNEIENGNYNLEIINQLGEIVYSQHVQVMRDWEKFNIDISNIKAGLYYVKLNSDKQIFTTKFTKL